ncbi:MAG: hypothetical protein SFY95_01085 [Planctomycetota bacterium]|nr:hypothetical protein [Planctomycetota bacterium]
MLRRLRDSGAARVVPARDRWYTGGGRARDRRDSLVERDPMNTARMVKASAAMVLAAAGLARAQTAYTWNGPASGVFNSAGNWSPFGIPDSFGEYFLLQGATATLNASIAVDKFGLGGGTVVVPGFLTFGVRADVPGAMGGKGIGGGGRLLLDGTPGSATMLIYGAPGEYFIYGDAGQSIADIEMTDTTEQQITGTASGVGFLFRGRRLFGAGSIGQNVLALGLQREPGGPLAPVIEATFPNNALTIDPQDASGMLIDDGVLRAGGGTLVLTSSTFTGINGARFEVSNVHPNNQIVLSSTRVVGGLFVGPAAPTAGQVVRIEGASTIADAEINATVLTQGFRSLTPEGTLTLAPNGRISFAGTPGGAFLVVRTPSATLTGPGGAEMSNTPENYFTASVVGHRLVNDLGLGIRGAGFIGQNVLDVRNLTLIEAVGSAGLRLDPPDSFPLANLGTIRSTAGATLTIENGTVNNAGGVLEALVGSGFALSNARIASGELRAPDAAFTVDGTVTLANVAISGGSTVLTQGFRALAPEGVVSLGDGARLRLQGTPGVASLQARTANVTLQGAGGISMSNSTENQLTATVVGHRLVNELGAGIVGAGNISGNILAVTNRSLIASAGSAGLTIDPPDSFPLLNEGEIRAGAGAPMTIINGTVDNSQGVLTTEAGGSMSLSNLRVAGGFIEASEGGPVHAAGTLTIADATLSASTVLNVPGFAVFVPEGTLAIEGQVRLNGTPGQAVLQNRTPLVQLVGGGSVVMRNSSENLLTANVVGYRLINNLAGGIVGAGNIGGNILDVQNQTLIEARGSAGMVVDPPDSFALDNNGVMSAASGSTLTVLNGTVDNAQGTLRTASGSSMVLSNLRVSGGMIEGPADGPISIAGTVTLAGVTIGPDAVVNVPGFTVLVPEGTVTVAGRVRVNGTPGNAAVQVRTPTATLAGAGTVRLKNTSENTLTASVVGYRLVLEGVTLAGSGFVGSNIMALTNRGTILADQSVGLVLDPPDSTASALLNDVGGAMEVAPGSLMSITTGPFETRGRVEVEFGGKLDRTSGAIVQTGGETLAHGEIEVDDNSYQLQGGTLGGTGLVDSNVSQSGGVVSPGPSVGTLAMEGNYALGAAGELRIEGDAAGWDRLNVQGAVTLGGVLRLARADLADPICGEHVILTHTGARTGTFTSIVQEPGLVGSASVVFAPGEVRIVYRPQDFDGSGFIDSDDFALFNDQYVLGCQGPGVDPFGPNAACVKSADFDSSGFVDSDDYAAFVVSFFNGCLN